MPGRGRLAGPGAVSYTHLDVYKRQIQNTEAGIRKVLNVPDNYKIGFFQGGATQQFAMVPLNFMTTGTADYLVTRCV